MLQRKTFIDATSDFMLLNSVHVVCIWRLKTSKVVQNVYQTKGMECRSIIWKLFSLFMIYNVFLYKIITKIKHLPSKKFGNSLPCGRISPWNQQKIWQ